MFAVITGDPPIGETEETSALQKAVFNRSVPDSTIFELSANGLRKALDEIFSISEPDLVIHPEYAPADQTDTNVVVRFLRRALVTALVEQGVAISNQMGSWLSPFSVSPRA